MKTKHTPGPWLMGDENNASCEVMIGETVCVLSRDTKYSEQYVIDRSEMLANAHLIMAAPDMLNALLIIQRRLQIWEPGYEELTAAITKATTL